MRHKNLLMFLISTVAVGAGLLFVLTKAVFLFSLNLPIAIKRGFPLPILLWMVAFVYGYVSCLLFSLNFRKLLASIFVVGFTIHILPLLLKLKLQLYLSPDILTSKWYMYYFQSFVLLVLVIFTIFCIKRFLDLEKSGVYEKFITFPFFWLLVYIFIFLLTGRFYRDLVFLFCVLAIVLIAINLKHLLKKIKAIRIFVLRLFQNEASFLILLSLAALAIRLFYLFRIIGTSDYLLTGSDSTRYDALARNFISGTQITDSYACGYWLFLAGVYKLFGTGYLYVGFIQSFISAFSCALIYFITKEIFNRTAAKIAIVVAAISYPLIFSSVVIGYQVMDVFYSCMIIFLSLKYISIRKQGKAASFLLIVLGILFGLIIATRETNLLMPFLFIICFTLLLRKKVKLASLLNDGAVVILVTLLCLAPFIARNIIQTGVWYPVFTSYQDEKFGSMQKQPIKVNKTAINYYSEYVHGENSDLTKNDIDFFNPSKTSRTFLKKPWHSFKVVISNFYEKFKNLYFSQGYGGFDMLFLYRMSDYYYALWFYAYLFTLIGVIYSLIRYKLSAHILILFFIIYRTVIHLLTESSYRHRASVEPYLIMYFVFGISLLWHISAEKER